MKTRLLVGASVLAMFVATPALADLDNINSINQSHYDVAGVYQVGTGNTNITNQNGTADGVGNFDWTLQIAGAASEDGPTGTNSKDLTQNGDGHTNLTLQGAFGGVDNLAIINQAGTNNNADTIQYGVNLGDAEATRSTNSTTVNQTGTGNSSLAIQAGVDIFLSGSSNTLTVNQTNVNDDTATGNMSNAFQGAHDNGLNAATVNQTGNANTSNLYQSSNDYDNIETVAGTGNVATVNQTGDANENSLFQVSVYGGSNAATVNQTGDRNENYLFQMAGQGANVNTATINQTGNDNTASSLQVAFGASNEVAVTNELSITQNGDDNSVSSVQYADGGVGNGFTLNQNGNNNTAVNMQVNYIPGEGYGADYGYIIENLAHVTPHAYVGGVDVYGGISSTPLPELDFMPVQPNIGNPGVSVGAHTVTHTITVPTFEYRTISLDKPAPASATVPTTGS